MFGSLKQGNICYILIKGEKPILKIGTVESVSNPMPKYPTYNPSVPFGAQQETVIDAKIKAGEEVMEFQKLPTNVEVFTYPNVIVISITNSEKEFLKSYHHELGHCAVHICQFYGIPLEGEEVQYLGQDLVDRTWDIAKIFLCDCDCCKNKRNEKKRDFEGNESHEK